MERTTVKDMTIGSPMKLVLGFAMPLLFGFLFQQLYSFVDTAIVGKALGAQMLAAVGCTGSLNFLIIGFCSGLCSGFAIPIAQAFGAKEEGELRRYLAHAIYLCAAISVVLGVATSLLCPAMLRLMNTDQAIFDAAVSYIQLIFAAIPVTVLYNMAGGVLRSLGDSKTPVVFLAIASLVNIVLDLLFILVFHMGVQGAAVATVISQLVSGVGCVVVMMKRFPMLRLSREERRFRPRYALHLMSVGIPMGLQFSITAIGSVIAQWSVNGISVAAVSAMTAGGKISMFFACAFDALATTMATYAGQNMGAKKPRRILQGLNAASIIGIIYCVIAYIVIWLFGKNLVGLFVDVQTDPEVIDMSYQFLMINGAFYIPLLFVNIVRLSIQGMGYTQIAMFAGVAEMAARTLVAVLIVPIAGFPGACFANPTAWLFADLFLIPCFARLMRKMKVYLRPLGHIKA